ncbi:LamG domain-containing protein [Streptomyces lydicus]|uniref:LamG domain-containing protein n=1 Tax=Streptomyces lydicus TaxID=47763 RepID=UPI001012FE46|nr:LamG domain-containing protein [Streptomyces lydicus]MCZ1006325.1 LamG domain-containing protein [Streptomyces lydicus]
MTVPTGFPIADGPLIASWPRLLLQVAWTSGGNASASNHWYTLTKRIRGSWKAAPSGRQYETDSVQSGTASFVLDNLDGALDPDNTASPFYPYVLPYRRLRLVLQTAATRNLLYYWVANGTQTTAMAATAGTIDVVTGLSTSPSGLTTAGTWALPNATASGAVYGLSGAAASWLTNDCEGTTVTPGASYAAGVEMQLAPGGMSSLSMQLRIGWYDLSGTLLSTTTGINTAITTSWSGRLTAAGTAPASAEFAIISVATTAATTAATTVRVTGWQLEQGSAATAWTGAGDWFQIWQGFAESWVQRYERGGKYGLVEVAGVDGLAPLSQLTLQDVMPQYLASIAPANQQYVYDLAAPGASPIINGGSAFLPISGTAATGAGLDVVGANIAYGTSITSTTDQGKLWNVDGPVTTLLSNQASALGNSAGATYLQPWDGTDRLTLPAAGWTRMICFRTTATPGTGGRFTQAALWASTGPGFISATGDQSGALMGIYSTGRTVAKVQNAAGAGVYYNGSVSVCDGNWHCAALTLSADGKTVHMVVDGVINTSTAASSMGSSTYTVDAVGALLTTNGSGENTQPFNGDIAWYAQWNTEVDLLSLNVLTRGFAGGWAQDAITSRIDRLLALAQFHPGSQLPGGTYYGSSGTLGGTTLNGRTALDAIQQAADTEGGQFVMDRYGTPTLYGHLWRWIQSVPQAIFGENNAAGEIPYQEDVTFAQDPARLFNDVQVTVEGALDATDSNTLQRVTDTASQSAYFPQSMTRSINSASVTTGLSIAEYLLSQYKDPHTRLGGLTVDLGSAPGRIPTIAALGFGTLVRVMRRPALAPAKQLDCFVEQIEWSGSEDDQLQVHMQMSPASQYTYWIVSAAWAALATSPSAGATALTVGPISGNSAIAAQYVIPAGFTMTLGYGTANAETVTVASVQTVTAGYTTVQLTLTAATTKAHTAGDLICSPKPGSATVPPGVTYPTCYDGAAKFGGTSPLIGY